MNTKTLKGILLYSLILIGSAFAVFAAIVIIMFIFPNLKLFGYGMISKKETTSNSTAISTSEISQPFDIIVSAGNFDISIYNSNEDSISYSVYNNCLGASNLNSAGVKEEITSSSYTLNITEPSGWVFYRDSNLKISLPENLKYNFIIKSNNGNISISNLQINNLKLNTSDGNFYLSHENQAELELNNVNISTNSGNFNFKSKYENVKINNGLTFSATRGDLLFDNLESDVELVGNDIYFEANTVTTLENGFNANVSNIVLKVFNHLNSSNDSQNSILTSSCLINIKEITGTSSIKSSNGNITIETIHSSAIIASSDGNVNVNTAEDYIKIDCKYSDITLNEYAKSAYIKSLSGNISAHSTSNDVNNSTEIITTNGNINHSTNLIPFKITSDGLSNINVEISNFDKEHGLEYLIDAPNSSVKVKYPGNCYFKYLISGNIDTENGDSVFVENKNSSPQIHPKDVSNFSGDISKLSLLELIVRTLIITGV